MGFILAVIGGFITYGSNKLIKILNISEDKELIVKTIGLITAVADVLKLWV
ncbi:hypothetical protein [Thermobrachium celere]|uniref:Uncharacterized protein n=1 Tax=Thermobrachium celere DSM 8682 TaxID=941824 RepID=R7RTD5_9CLOT|nr:hypothetical protein [Thermobrachium celere]CDF58508.1 hypothetical protein TCEL_00554 [Thermobrachium celere DSM 8682]